ncbi:MAG TPA: MASE1 domain-containing protein [Thermoanaerobaculia bacterium]|nr:MASE1 domain-containing protein [Thermoanaerobaculia bacterium]
MSSIRRLSRDALLVLGVAILYVACAKLGLALAFRAAQVTSVWPPTGFALAAVLLLGWRSVPGILLGAFFANATAGEPLWVAGGIACGNTLEALGGAMLLRRFAFDSRLARARDVIALIAAVALMPILSASIGVACLGIGGVQPVSALPALWSVWWLGDALGGLIVAPLLLVWSSGDRIPRRRGAIVEGCALLASSAAASTVAFINLGQLAATEYVVFPFLIWAALRFGPVGTATVAVIVNSIAVWGTQLGRGPFAGAGPESGLVLLQLFMAVAAATGLLLGAIATQNRNAQQHAEVSERRLLMAMSAARTGVWDWNIRTGEVLWSDALEPLHGLPRGGFAGTYEAFRKLIHPEDVERVEAEIRKCVETKVPYEADFRIAAADGVTRWTSARGQIVEDEHGNAVRMIGIGTDVTQQKQLEEELRLHVRRKDEFLAMLGHELRNPLAPILHAVELLGRGDATLAERAREIIHRQSQHLNRLVDDLLDVSRITRGSVRLDRRRVTLSDVLVPAVDTWRHYIAARRQQLTIDLPSELIWLDVDRMRFTQIIANLLHNAAKFTPDEGRIDIAADVEDSMLTLRVRDSGEGMSADVLAHVFEVFVQGPPPLDRPQGGLGVGLTLVRRLVELHAGSVEAMSTGTGCGSEFIVRVPLSSAPLVVEETPRVAAPGEGSRRILVVDDNADARDALMMLLAESGHEVRTASDGPRAIAEAARFSPEIVLLDIGLPGMDGYAVAEALRKLPQCAEALIVAVTGYGQPEDRERSRAAGLDEHLLKPIEPSRVLALVQGSRNASVT